MENREYLDWDKINPVNDNSYVYKYIIVKLGYLNIVITNSTIYQAKNFAINHRRNKFYYNIDLSLVDKEIFIMNKHDKLYKSLDILFEFKETCEKLKFSRELKAKLYQQIIEEYNLHDFDIPALCIFNCLQYR